MIEMTMMADPFIKIEEVDSLNPAIPKLAVLGYPVKHSLSPFMHNAALAELVSLAPKLIQWKYYGIETPAEDLFWVLPKLHEHGFYGVNLTIPHKVDVLPLLEEVSEEALQIGAVNTLIRTKSGWKGTNTDGFGIIRGIEESLKTYVRGKSVLLLGAGGASRAIAVACLSESCSELVIANRSKERLDGLVDLLKRIDSFKDKPIKGISPSEIDLEGEKDWILINATSLGLKAEDPSLVSGRQLMGQSVSVYDTTYGCRNQLALLCQDLHLPYANGLTMLVWQGVKSLEIWTGQSVSAEAMKLAAKSELKNRGIEL